MTEFDKLDRLLSGSFSDDYWSDDAIDLARANLSELSPDDWKKLASEWQSRPGPWQLRLADALGAVDDPHAVEILHKIIEGANIEVLEMALDSLDQQDLD